ncbi:MAG: G8 domain-containing protein, partial [Casimicrobium sp.]
MGLHFLLDKKKHSGVLSRRISSNAIVFAAQCCSLLFGAVTLGAYAQCPFNAAGLATASANNDGLHLTRAAQLIRGNELIAKTSTTLTADTLIANLANNESRLDVNASGAFDETDAAIIVRHLLGFKNEALIPGGAGGGALRKTANDIQSYIDGGCVAPAPARKKLSQMPRSNGGVLISILDDVEIDQDATLEWLEIQGSLVCTDRNLNLTAKWIIVHGGSFQCGTALNSF